MEFLLSIHNELKLASEQASKQSNQIYSPIQHVVCEANKQNMKKVYLATLFIIFDLFCFFLLSLNVSELASVDF